MEASIEKKMETKMQVRAQATLPQTMFALEKLMRMFVIERYLYLALSGISFVILLVFTFQLLNKGATEAMMVTVFGGSGVVAASALRVTVFFNRAFSLVESVINGGQK